MSSTGIHWARILLGAVLAEVALILAIVPLGLRLGDNFLHYAAPPRVLRHVLPGSALGVSADRIPLHSAWDVGGCGRGADLRCLDARAARTFCIHCGPRAETDGWRVRRLRRPAAAVTVSAATRSRLIHCLTSSGSRSHQFTFLHRIYTDRFRVPVILPHRSPSTQLRKHLPIYFSDSATYRKQQQQHCLSPPSPQSSLHIPADSPHPQTDTPRRAN